MRLTDDLVWKLALKYRRRLVADQAYAHTLHFITNVARRRWVSRFMAMFNTQQDRWRELCQLDDGRT